MDLPSDTNTKCFQYDNLRPERHQSYDKMLDFLTQLFEILSIYFQLGVSPESALDYFG
ncbi:hypothetical protein N9D38_01555 [Rubripirellula sp.]|nr:hypothetical protein [Rubripirellula sp.]